MGSIFAQMRVCRSMTSHWTFSSVTNASSISRCGSLGKEAYFSEKSDGLQGNPENDGPAWLQCLGNCQTHQRLPNGRPLLAAIQRGWNLWGYHARTSQKNYERKSKEQLIPKSQTSPYILYSLRFGFSLIILHQRERWLIILSA